MNFAASSIRDPPRHPVACKSPMNAAQVIVGRQTAPSSLSAESSVATNHTRTEPVLLATSGVDAVGNPVLIASTTGSNSSGDELPSLLPSTTSRKSGSVGMHTRADRSGDGGNGRPVGGSMRRLSSATTSSLDADDEADSSSHAATPPLGHSLDTSPSPPSAPPPKAEAAPLRPRSGAAEGMASSSLSSSSQLPLGSPVTGPVQLRAPLKTKKDDVNRRARASSGESTTESSRTASPVARPLTTKAAIDSGNYEKDAAGLLGPTGNERGRGEGNAAAAPQTPKESSGVSRPLRTPVKDATKAIATPTTFAPGSIPPVLSRGPPVNMEQFGSCVFFFPTPVLSWLFPLSGHVAISNAEGTRLYTFEASYFVREERMVDVLDRVIESIRQGNGTSGSNVWRHSSGVFRSGGEAGQRKNSSSSVTGAESDGPLVDSPIGSPAPASLSSGCEGDSAPGRRTRHTSRLPACLKGRAARGYPGSPIRRQVKQLNSYTSGSHSHTTCVRIWDLKPLLMESRGSGGGRAWLPLRLVSKARGGNGAVGALWQRLQDLISVEGAAAGAGAGSSSGGEDGPTPHAPLSLNGAATQRRGASAGVSERDDGASGSETEEERNRLLDPATARFFNKNLQATINIFRGSPEGSRAPLDIIVKSTNSYSFVGFVLETCGLGGGAAITTTTTTTTAKARDDTSVKSSPPSDGVSTTATKLPSGQSTPASGVEEGGRAELGTPHANTPAAADVEVVVDGISWGMGRILLNLMLFGEWHRSERRVWRVAHGGTMTGAFAVWAALLVVLASCVLPFVSGWWRGQAAAGAGAAGAGGEGVADGVTGIAAALLSLSQRVLHGANA